jgi:predicted O-linked N-acetylglucosamine transferase (SPINDLY family)
MSYELFSTALAKAIQKELPVPELFSVAQQLTALGQRNLTVTLYREWINANGDSPVIHAVCFNYGIILSDMGDQVAAAEVLKRATVAAPGFMPAFVNLGSTYERMGQTGLALEQWFHVVNQLGAVNSDNLNYKTMALKQSCRVLEGINALGKGEETLRMSLDVDPHQREVIQHWINLRLRQNKWPIMEAMPNLSKSQLLQGIAPLTLLNYTDDPLFQLATAHYHHKLDVGRPTKFYTPQDYPRVPKSKLRIGYVSSDMRAHAVGFLTSEIFELHDRDKVEIFVYYCGINYVDPTYTRIKEAADHWINVTGQDIKVTAEQIRTDQIDILVDLNGYTKDGLFQLFAMRPAPINVNWLGYPGTLGTPCHDYIIADDYIVPPGSEHYYSEKVARLPCYQPNDRKRVVGTNVPSRTDVGLPENGVVYCSFNGTQKITSFTFARWMKILHAVPDSVLWLLKCGENSDAYLMELASQHGIDPARLVFADRKGNADHIARYVLADLFLDTLPYGAHTTASDALFMGLPVLTLPGRGFASRVCASLVRAAGVPEFVCETSDEYVQRAIEFGLDRSKLEPYRQRLLATRYSSVLFDTPALVRSLEGLYADMWNEFVNDTIPRPKLINMDVYRDIGATLDHDSFEFACLPNYEDLYREKLLEWDRFSALEPDGRLWPCQG